MTTYRIDLTPAFRETKPGVFAGQGRAFMRFDGQLIGESRAPLFAAARWLQDNGHAQPGDKLETYRDGMLCMSAPVDIAAGLTVHEPDVSRMSFTRFQPFNPETRPARSTRPTEGHLPACGSREERG